MLWPLFGGALLGLVSQVLAADLNSFYSGRYGPELFGSNLKLARKARKSSLSTLNMVVEEISPVTNAKSIEQTLDVYQRYILPISANGSSYLSELMALTRRTEYFTTLLEGAGKLLVQNDARLAQKYYDTICAILFASVSEFDKPQGPDSEGDVGVEKVVDPMLMIVGIVLEEFPSTSHLSTLFLGREFFIRLIALLKSPIEKERKLVTRTIEDSLMAFGKLHQEAHSVYCSMALVQMEEAMVKVLQAEGNQIALRPMLEVPYILELLMQHVKGADGTRYVVTLATELLRMPLSDDALHQSASVAISAIQNLSGCNQDRFRDAMEHILKQNLRREDRDAERFMLKLWVDCIVPASTVPEILVALFGRIFTAGRVTRFPENAEFIACSLRGPDVWKSMTRQPAAVLQVLFQGLLEWLRQRDGPDDETSASLIAFWQFLQECDHFRTVLEGSPEWFSKERLGMGPNLAK